MGRQSFSSIISARAGADPDSVVAVSDTGSAPESLTAAELDTASNALGRELIARGVRRDDLVAISLPTGIEFLICAAAVWKAGATPHPLSADLARDERAEIERLGRPALAIGAAPADSSIPHLPPGFIAEQSGAPLPDTWANCWKAPMSSGSTGRPKIVKAAAPALLDPASAVAPFLPTRAVQLVTGPLWHSASFTYAFRGLLTGHRLILAARFEAHRFCDLVDRHAVTWALLSPDMIHRLVRVPDRSEVTSLRTVLHLGARCSVADKRALIDWLGPDRVTEIYAGAESNGLTMITGRQWLGRPGSVGTPLGDTEIRILRGDGSMAATGEVGQIWMRRGQQPAYSYVGAPSHRTDDGWDSLADLGFLDEDGYLTILERACDVIVRDGVALYPSQVEHVLQAHPSVRAAVVFADGPELAAVLEVGVAAGAAGTQVPRVDNIEVDDETAASVRRFAAAHLTGVELPSQILLTRSPVRNEAGKARRSALRIPSAANRTGRDFSARIS